MTMPSTADEVRAELLAFLASECPRSGEGSVAQITGDHRYVVCLRARDFAPDPELAGMLRKLGFDDEPVLGRQQRRCYGFATLEQALAFDPPDGYVRVALWDAQQSSVMKALITPSDWQAR